MSAGNLHIRNGAGATDIKNGPGNLILGYNDLHNDGTDNRTGSHNFIAGKYLDFSGAAGIVTGYDCGVYNDYAAVIAATSGSSASGVWSFVIGVNNHAAATGASVTRGRGNHANGISSAVSGGFGRTAADSFDGVTGTLFENQ